MFEHQLSDAKAYCAKHEVYTHGTGDMHPNDFAAPASKSSTLFPMYLKYWY